MAASGSPKAFLGWEKNLHLSIEGGYSDCDHHYSGDHSDRSHLTFIGTMPSPATSWWCRGALTFAPPSRRYEDSRRSRAASPLSGSHYLQGEREGNNLRRTPPNYGECYVPSFLRGAHDKLVVVRGAAVKGPRQGGHFLPWFRVQEGGDQEGARLVEGLDPLLDGRLGKLLTLFLFVISLLC